MACNIQDINFTKNGSTYVPYCTVTPTDNVGADISVYTDSSVNVYCYVIFMYPDGTTHGFYANGGNKITIVGSGTVHINVTKNDGLNTSTPGNYSIQSATILNESKSATLCWSTIVGNCSNLQVSSPSPPLSANITSCPPGTVSPGSTIPFTVSWSGGSGPYDLYIYNTTDNTDWFYQYGINATSININSPIKGSAGSTYILGAKVVDSSAPPKTSYSTSQCTIRVESPPPPTTYQCINNVCTQRSCIVGTANCYTTNNCNNVCTLPPPTQPCIPKVDEMILFGTCIKKSYVYMGAGFFALMMILKK